MKRSSIALVCFVFAALFAGACSDDGNPPASGGAGASPIPSSGPTSPSTPADGGLDAAPDAEPVGAALCQGIEQRSQEVAEIALAGAAPAPTGGTPALGRYVLNELVAYGGVADADASDPPPPAQTGTIARSTLIVSAKNVRFLGSSGTADVGLPADEARASSYFVDGAALKLVSQCGGADAMTTIPFSAGEGTLTLHRPGDKLETYRLDRF